MSRRGNLSQDGLDQYRRRDGSSFAQNAEIRERHFSHAAGMPEITARRCQNLQTALGAENSNCVRPAGIPTARQVPTFRILERNPRP